MAFTFQINNSLKFKHDEKLLAKAEANRPQIIKTQHSPARIVDIVEDPAWLGGWGPAESEKKIDKLSSYGCKRDDTLVLDFGDHMVGTFKIHIDQTGSPMDAPSSCA